MGAVVDTSVLIAVERGQLVADALAGEDEDDQLVISAITASELLHGTFRLKGAVARAHAERFVQAVLAAFPVVAFDLPIARVHAHLAAELGAAGTPVGAADLIIAATAVHLNYRIATRDMRSFGKIRGLKVVKW